MRAMFLLTASLAMMTGACASKKGGTPPPPIKKELMIGKWKAPTPDMFLAGWEFADNGTAKMTIQGMKHPITAHYAWTGDRSMEVEYPKDADLRQAYESAAKKYRHQIDENVKKDPSFGKAATGMLAMLVDQLPEKETFLVGISDPSFLVLVRGNTTMNYEKAEVTAEKKAEK